MCLDIYRNITIFDDIEIQIILFDNDFEIQISSFDKVFFKF